MSAASSASVTGPVTGQGQPMLAGASGLLALLEPLLAQAAGEGARAVSLQLSLAAAADDGPLELTARVERATRTLVFASAEARRADGALAATVEAIFARGQGASG